jgi:N-acylneuraminate cytidylyltransferase
MIAWTIKAALDSNLFSKVLVSTDCEEISKVSRKYGAEVPFLRTKNSDDFTEVSEATYGALIQAENHWGIEFDTVTQLMANCPLRSSKAIKNFYKEFLERDIDFLLSCFKFGWMNPWWAFKINENKSHSFIFDNAIKERSQDLEDLFCPTGSIWMAKVRALKKTRSFYNRNQQFFEIDWISAVDIDDENDLSFAKSLQHLK